MAVSTGATEMSAPAAAHKDGNNYRLAQQFSVAVNGK